MRQHYLLHWFTKDEPKVHPTYYPMPRFCMRSHRLRHWKQTMAEFVLLQQAVILLPLMLFASNVAAQQQTITIPAAIEVMEPSAGGGPTNTLSFGTWSNDNSLTLTYTYGDDTAKGGATCTENVDFLNQVSPQTISQGSSITVVPYTVCSDTVDEPRETYVVVIRANFPIFDENEPNCLTSRNCSTTVTIIDDDPTIITNDGLQAFDIPEGQTTIATITLGRALEENERIDLEIARIPISSSADTSDYSLKLRSGQNFNAGVTLDDTNPEKLKLTFGKGAEVATLVFRAIHDDETNEASEQLVLNISPADTTMIDGGVSAMSGTLNPIITIENNPNKPLRIRAKVLLEGPLQ